MEFRILGPLQVLEGERELRLASAKERALLAVLLLHAGAIVSRDRLIEELWGESPPPTAAKALNVHVSQLRKALAANADDAIATRAPGYVLEVEPERLDAARFERLVAQARARSAEGDARSARRLLREALALWRGPALDGVELEGAARNEVGRLEELRLAAQLDRIDCDLAVGLHEQLIGELEALVVEHPLRERLRGQLMLALYRSGRQADALRSYRETRATLVEELGIEPSLPLQRLEKAILTQDPSLEAPVGVATLPTFEAPLPGGDPARTLSRVDVDTDLPVGTVTFLLTDVEGSTGLWEAHPEAMTEAMTRQRAITVETIERHGGRLPRDQGEGDSVLAVFAHAPDAVTCALELQLALMDEDWPEALPVRVRVALHSGEAKLRDENYSGAAVNRCARLRGIAHGGQVLLSRATAELTCDRLPAGAALLDLGDHRLKDVARAERVFQLAHPELRTEFPPLRSLEERKHNLPAQLTSFIGREPEIAELKELLKTTRLATLTGAGGSGKTRLALEVAAEVVREYADGAWLVELAGLSDPTLVTSVVAQAVGVREEPARPLVDALADALRMKQLLLLFDNCEHVVAACASLAQQLLETCPGLTVLATSREPLAIRGETVWGVPSLSLPATAQAEPAEVLASEAVRLFVERARSAKRSFTASAENMQAIIEICRRLDGIPLAIELAAARVRLLTPAEIAARLDDRFTLLTGATHDVLPRHRTLRALVDWSYELLSEPERLLFGRLSVFAGGFGMEAAAEVCAGDGVAADAVLDVVAQLVDKSLLVVEERNIRTRYRMLETIRDYARARLAESGEEARVRSTHLGWFMSFAEEAERELGGPTQASWLDVLEDEHDNVRAALEWGLTGGDSEIGLRLAGALGRFWEIHGHLSEGRRWLEALLDRVGSEATHSRAKALTSAGRLADRQADRATASAQVQKALAMSRTLGDRRREALLLRYLGEQAYWPGDFERARAHFDASLTISRELDDKEGICSSLEYLGMVAQWTGDFAIANAWFEQSLEIARELGNRIATARALMHLGGSAVRQGDYALARELCHESLAIAEELKDKDSIARTLGVLCDLEYALGDHAKARSLYEEWSRIWREVGAAWVTLSELQFGAFMARDEDDYAAAEALLEEVIQIEREWGYRASIISNVAALGDIARRQGDFVRAGMLLAEAAALARDVGMKLSGCWSIEAVAKLAAAQGQDEVAACLFGAADALRGAMEAPLPPSERASFDDFVKVVRARLEIDAFENAWERGRNLSWPAAIEEALTVAAVGGASSAGRVFT